MTTVHELKALGTYGALFSLGKHFFYQGQYSKAKTIFDGLMALDDRNLEVSLAYGNLLLAQEQSQKAYEHFIVLRNMFGPDEKILLGIAKSYALLGKYDEAKQILTPLLLGKIKAEKATILIAKAMTKLCDADCVN